MNKYQIFNSDKLNVYTSERSFNTPEEAEKAAKIHLTMNIISWLGYTYKVI